MQIKVQHITVVKRKNTNIFRYIYKLITHQQLLPQWYCYSDRYAIHDEKKGLLRPHPNCQKNKTSRGRSLLTSDLNRHV